jgi:hypothetical protein
VKYYLGPWQWVTNRGPAFFAAPAGIIGAIDLGTIPEMGAGGKERKGCLCWTDENVALGSEYDLLGTGDVREIKRTAKIQSVFRNTIGSAPAGDKLHDMILDCMIDGSDPDGLTAPKSIVPDADGWIELMLPGHGKVKSERFEWGRNRHTAKLRRMLRAEFSQIMGDAESGKLKDKQHHRRVLDALCEKYGVTEWREFVPTARQKDVPGRLQHETSISESFDKADSSTLGPDLTWTEVNGDWSVVSNAARVPGISTYCSARAESDLSSADHEAQIDAITSTDTGTQFTQLGPSARFSPSAGTYYSATLYKFGNSLSLQKVVSNTQTNLASQSITVALPESYKIKCSGSAITSHQAGVQRLSVTDTSITGNLRCGINGFTLSGVGVIDNLLASDLASSGIRYTQLERGTRGVERGVYTGWGR